MHATSVQRVMNLLRYGSGTPITFAAGKAALAPPSGTTLVGIFPPPGNTSALTLMGSVNDSGVALAANEPSIFSITSGASLIISAAASVAAEVVYTKTEVI